MDPTTAHQGIAGAYQMLTDLGGLAAGILALIAGLLAYAGGLRQARATRKAAAALLAVEGALGRLPAVALMTAFENVTDAAQRLRAAAMNGAEAAPAPADDPSRSLTWLRPGTNNRRPVAVGERVAL